MGTSRKKHCWIGLDIGGTKVLAGLLDKNFKLIGEKKARVDAHRGKVFFLKTIRDSVEELLQENQVSRKHVRALGAGCPGISGERKRARPVVAVMARIVVFMGCSG